MKTHPLLIAFTLACTALLPWPAHADDALYRTLGGQPALVKLADDFMTRLLADARMHPFFKDVDQQQFKKHLVEQLCQVTGGACQYTGSPMKKIHAGHDIDKAAFNALVEVLQQSMDAQGIPFGVQNEVLALLAPMHREIVNIP